jgi:hypothetical protein
VEEERPVVDAEGDSTENKSSEKRKHQLLKVGILLSCVFPRREMTISLTRAPFWQALQKLKRGERISFAKIITDPHSFG